MIYTCFDMIRDCRADRAEGWSYFVTNYVPAARALLEHYGGAALLDRVLVALRRPESSLFASLDPAPERSFLAELRQHVMAELDTPPPAIPLDLETVAAAYEPLTVTEKQAAWLETMRYSPADSAAMLRMAPETVGKIRERAAELLRSKVDAWNRNLLAANGLALGRAAAAAAGKDCLPARGFLDVLDGRATWRDREAMERHVNRCWHCIDHFCRVAEVNELRRRSQPLADAEAEPFRKLLGVPEAKRSAWKRWMG